MMFDNKIDVDRHVENCLKKTNSESERNLRSFAFAKLYFHVGEYDLSRRYVSSYLIAKPHAAEAHQLLGKIYERLGKMEAAYESYKMSLDFDPKQSNLVIRVCELLAKEDILMDPSKIQYWCERARLLDPQNPVIFNLREKIFSMANSNSEDIQNLFLSELEMRPTDVALRIRLLQHLLDCNQISNAYKHIIEIEKKNSTVFSHNLSWYETAAKIFIRYKNINLDNGNLNWEFWIYLISVLDKLATLNLYENNPQVKTLIDCSTAIFNFDQTLSVAYENINKTCTEKQLIQEFIDHYKAQLCFHMATLVFKQAKKIQLKYKEATNLAIPLLFISYRYKPSDITSLWLDQSTDDIRKLIHRWHYEASYRCSQAGHIILALSKEKHNSILNFVKQLTTGSWREKTFKNIYITRDQQFKMDKSYFVKCPQLDDFNSNLPDQSELVTFDETAQNLHPSSLHHMIWIGLNSDPSRFNCCIFKGLQYSIKNFNNCAAETLNILDIQAFLYCCIFCAHSQIEDSKQTIGYNRERPGVFPASITENLGTADQRKWFTSIYKTFTNDCGSDLSDIRLTVIRGLEIVRCVGTHGLDVKLLVLLASTFAQRAKLLSKQFEIDYNEARAELYWKTALPLLEKLQSNQPINYPVKRWFEYKGKELTLSQINNYIEEGKLFSAVQLMRKKEHEKALHLLETLKNPYASYYQAQTYKCLAENQMSHNKESLTSEMRSQHIILLSKARDCLYLTLDRLREPSVDRKHPLNAELGTEIEKIERSLSRIDPDICGNRNDCDGMSDENDSSADSINEHTNLSSMYLSFTNYHNGNTTPRNDHHNVSSNLYRSHDLNHSRRIEARPSPERLDAQLRQMVATKDATVTHILEQNRLIADSHRTLIDEMRSIKDAIVKVSAAVDELKTMKKTVEDVTSSVEQLMSMKKLVLDLKDDDLPALKVQIEEIKKDFSELKKDSTKLKTNQIDEEDLYALEDEYNVDYNINAGATGFNSAALYQGFPQRLQGANPLAYGAPGLYGMYPMYPYSGLGLGQPSTLPFPDGPIPGFRMGSIAQGLSHTSLTQNQALNQQQALNSMLTKLPTDTNMYPKFDGTGLPINAQAQFLIPPTVPQVAPLSNFGITPQPQPQVSSYVATVPANIPANVPVNVPASKAPPVNVVITASDPLPTTSVAQPVLSVIIPPQHLKGAHLTKSQAHNYQIPLPTTQPAFTSVNTIPVTVLPVTTQALLSNVAAPIYSSLTVKSNVSGDKQMVAKSPNASRTEGTESENNSLAEEHDACPDFKPIVPLPDEVPLTTGEENEEVMFCERAKLFRYTEKEWRERGLGNIKILHNKGSGKIRVLMRREQVHKICANHFLTPDIEINPLQKSDKAYIWAANDYADETMKAETFCVRFKTVEQGKRFVEAFELAKSLLKKNETKNIPLNKYVSTETKVTSEIKVSEPQTNFGGFIFKNAPSFQPKIAEEAEKPSSFTTTNKPSPFAKFSFESKTDDIQPMKDTMTTSTPNAQKHQKDTPTLEFKSLASVPSEIVHTLLELKAKLLHYNPKSKEWEELDVGVMKILKSKMVRLVMHNEQLNKVTFDQQLFKTMTFSETPKFPKVLTFCVQNPTTKEMDVLAIKFRTDDKLEMFKRVVHDVQNMLTEDNNVNKKSWKCNKCNIPSTEEKCRKCEDDSQYEGGQSPQRLKPSPAPLPSIGFGDKFKPKVGTWSCKICYVHNDGKNKYCEACESPRDDAAPKKIIASDTEKNFSFGVSAPSFGTTSTTTTTTSLWGDKFKPKVGSWNCQACYITNDGNTLYCIACNNPKDDTVPKKPQGINLSTSTDQKYNFGIPPSMNTKPSEPIFGSKPQPTAGYTFGLPAASVTSSFTFGVKPTTTESPKPSAALTGFQFSVAKTVEDSSKNGLPLDLAKNSFGFQLKPTPEPKNDEFIFGSPNKHDFEFKPKSPRKHGGGDNEDSNDSICEDDGEHIYFKPVIPLPDKIEVKTGEEDEEVLYCHRAKLFRFVGGEWKERGIGDIKVLKNKGTKKIRVVMRREQVLKICLNHVLTPDIKYMPKDERTWLFNAADYSEGEINHQQFCVRFKNAEIAESFIKVIKEVQNKLLGGGDISIVETKSDEDDVKIISETKVTLEEEQKALALKLPKNFYAYLQKDPCPGCRGCNDDNFVFDAKTVQKPQDTRKVEPPTILDNKSPICKPILNIPILKKTEESIVTSKPSFQFNFNNDNATTSNTTGTLFGSNNLFTNSKLSKPLTNIFSTENKFFPAANTFSTTTQSSIFAPKPESPSLTTLLTSDTKLPLSNVSNTNFTSPGNLFSLATPPSTTSIFGGDKKTDGMKKENAEPTKFFGNTQSVFKSAMIEEKPKDDITVTGTQGELKDGGVSIMNFESSLSFSALASKATENPAFAEKSDSKPFFFEGTGKPVFGSIKRAPDNKNDSVSKSEENEREEEHEGEATGEHDPHYEPIVPLPDAIDVKTGEEEEELLFTERSKLYRYDTSTKEWKERGVGNIKLLFHPIKETYRLLMRRECVYKLVLNMLIMPDFDIQQLQTSDRAWMWAGYNYSEDGAALEKLALKFKNVELANQFFVAVTTVKNNLSVRDLEDHEEEHDDEEYISDESNEEKSIVFSKRCTLSYKTSENSWDVLGMGVIKMYFESDYLSGRIIMMDDSGKQLCNCVIGASEVMELKETSCIWQAIDYSLDQPKARIFNARFSSIPAAEELYYNHQEIVSYAQHGNQTDSLPED